MLASDVLKLRLDRIEQQGHHLSVRDQLKLVTLAQPEFPNLSKQKANTSVSMPSYQIQPIKMSYEI